MPGGGQLKEKPIKRINETDDREILESFLRILDMKSNDEISLSISPDQKKSIEQGERDFRNGDFLTEKKSDAEAKKWLGK